MPEKCYLVLRAGGTLEVHLGAIEKTRPTLEDAQRHVGGWIERFETPTLPKDWCAFCNEEGKLKGLPPNVTATLLLPVYADDIIVGDVFICGVTDEGEFKWLGEDAVEKFKEVLNGKKKEA